MKGHGRHTSSKTVLDRFLVDNRELEELNSKLTEFNICRVLRVERAEIRHSNVLAWLLNPSESHGLGQSVLRRFLSNIILDSELGAEFSAAQIELMDMSGTEVRREWNNTDILLIDRAKRFVVLIENKVDSSDGAGQLKRYLEAVKKAFPRIPIIPVYLTLAGDPSDDEGGKGYLCCGYSRVLKVVAAAVEQRRSQMAQPVQLFLDHYLNSLRRLLMEDESVVKLCRTIYGRHKEAIDLIVRHGMASEFKEVATDFVKANSDLALIHSGARYVVFTPKSWLDFLPRNGDAWDYDPNVSVGCWFHIDGDREKVSLCFELTRMKDSDLRLSLVKALASARFKLDKAAYRTDAKFSRFYTSTTPLESDDSREAIKLACTLLFENAEAEFVRAGTVLKRVFKGEDSSA